MKTIQLNETNVSQYILQKDFSDEKTLKFLQKAIKKDLFLKEIDSYNNTITVSLYENSELITLPAPLFLLNEDINSDEEHEQPVSKPIFQHIKDNLQGNKMLLGFTIITLLILSKDSLFSNANDLTTDKTIIQQEEQIKNEFDILTEKANKNREVISQELQQQKKLRELEKQSIQRVKKLESENNEIRNNLLQLSQ